MVNQIDTLAEFKELIDSGKTIVVDFTATWCGPCKMMSPIFTSLAEELGSDDVVFIKVDNEIIKATPEIDVDRTSAEGKASSVQFIHFKFDDNQIEKFKSNSSSIEIGINHDEYSHTTKLNESTIKSLSTDFS